MLKHFDLKIKKTLKSYAKNREFQCFKFCSLVHSKKNIDFYTLQISVKLGSKLGQELTAFPIF